MFAFTSNKKVTLTLTQLLLIVSATVLLVVGGIVYWNNSRPDKLREYNKQFNEYQATVVKPLLEQNAQLKLTSDSLRAVDSIARITVSGIQKDIDATKGTLAQLRRKNQSLVDSINAKPVPVECISYANTINSLNTEVKTLTTQNVALTTKDSLQNIRIVALQASNIIERKRADDAERVIRSWPMPPKPNSVFGIRVSPKTAFVTGIVLTSAAAVVLHNNVDH